MAGVRLGIHPCSFSLCGAGGFLPSGSPSFVSGAFGCFPLFRRPSAGISLVLGNCAWRVEFGPCAVRVPVVDPNSFFYLFVLPFFPSSPLDDGFVLYGIHIVRWLLKPPSPPFRLISFWWSGRRQVYGTRSNDRKTDPALLPCVCLLSFEAVRFPIFRPCAARVERQQIFCSVHSLDLCKFCGLFCFPICIPAFFVPP